MGEDWDAQVRDALAVSELGLLAVSNAFLGSAYITGVELPALLDVPGKRAIPVSVLRTSRHADLHGLAASGSMATSGRSVTCSANPRKTGG